MMLDMLLCDYEEESQLATPGAGSNPSPSGASGASSSWHRGLSAVAILKRIEYAILPAAPVIAAPPAAEVPSAKEAVQSSGFQGCLTAREIAAVERFGRRVQEPEPSEVTGDRAPHEAATRSRGRGRGRGSGGPGGRPLDGGHGTWNQPFETPATKKSRSSPIREKPPTADPHPVPPLVLEPLASPPADVPTSAPPALQSASAAPALPKKARGSAGTFFGRYPPDSPRRLLNFQQLKEHFQRHHQDLSGTPRRSRKVGSATTAQMASWNFVQEQMKTAAKQQPEKPRTELMGEAVQAWRLDVESRPTPPAKSRTRGAKQTAGSMKPQSLADRLDAEDEARTLQEAAGASEQIASGSAKRCRTADGSPAGRESETSGRPDGGGGLGDGAGAGSEAGDAKAAGPADSKAKAKAKSKAKAEARAEAKAEAKAKNEPKPKSKAKAKAKAKSKAEAKPETPALKESELHPEDVAVPLQSRALESAQPETAGSGGAENSLWPRQPDVPAPECADSWDISMSAETCVLGETLEDGQSDSVAAGGADSEFLAISDPPQLLSGLPLQIDSELSGLVPPECEVEYLEEEPAYIISYPEDDGMEDQEANPPDSAGMSE